MRRIKVDGTHCEFEVHTPSRIPNAIRRALMDDVKNIAPDRITIRKNTSCQTDEFIAHRIGMIPFRSIDGMEGFENSKTTLNVSGRMATAKDIESSAYEAYIDVPIMKLGPDQSLDLDITFRTGTGSEHARFSHISAVSYKVEEKKTSIGFDTITDESPLVYLSAAVESLIQRIDDTIFFVEKEYDAKHTKPSF